jgi:hypothetical protein
MGRMKELYQEQLEEGYEQAQSEWQESDCVKKNCSHAVFSEWGCSIDCQSGVTDARSCKNFIHIELKEKNMGCDFCYWNSGGECKEGYGTPDPGNHCGGYIPVESTPRIEILMDSLKSALLAGDQEAVCVVDDWVAHCSRKSDKLLALRKGLSK